LTSVTHYSSPAILPHHSTEYGLVLNAVE